MDVTNRQTVFSTIRVHQPPGDILFNTASTELINMASEIKQDNYMIYNPTKPHEINVFSHTAYT